MRFSWFGRGRRSGNEVSADLAAESGDAEGRGAAPDDSRADPDASAGPAASEGKIGEPSAAGPGDSTHWLAAAPPARSWRWRLGAAAAVALGICGVSILSVYIYSVFDDGRHGGGDVAILRYDGDSRPSESGWYSAKHAEPGWWKEPAWRREHGPRDRSDGDSEGSGSRRRGARYPYGGFGGWDDWPGSVPPFGGFGVPGGPGGLGPFAKDWGGGSGWFGYGPFGQGGPAFSSPWPGRGFHSDDDYAEEHYPDEDFWLDGGEAWGMPGDGYSSGFGLSFSGLELVVMWIIELLSDPEVLSGLLDSLEELLGDGGPLRGLFGPDGLLGDGAGEGLFGPDGPFGSDGLLSGLLGFGGLENLEDLEEFEYFEGDAAELFGPDGPFGDLMDDATGDEVPTPEPTST